MKFLALLVWIVAVVVIVCADACADGVPANDAMKVSVDSVRHVACYRFVNYGGVSCVKLDTNNR